MNDLSKQKIQIAVFSTIGEPFDAVIDTLLDGELNGQYQVLGYDNPVDYTLVQSTHEG